MVLVIGGTSHETLCTAYDLATQRRQPLPVIFALLVMNLLILNKRVIFVCSQRMAATS